MMDYAMYMSLAKPVIINSQSSFDQSILKLHPGKVTMVCEVMMTGNAKKVFSGSMLVN